MSNEDYESTWGRLTQRFGQRRVIGVAWLIGVGIASLSVRLLVRYDFDHTALLYIAIPYLIAFAIMLLRPLQAHDSWWERYISHSVTAMTVFLASSVVLFEGFICVLMFVPIYFFVVTVAFLVHWASIAYNRRNQRRSNVFIVPVLFLFASLEGVTPALTFDRENSVIVTTTVAISADEVMHNLATPFDLQRDRHWLLAIFPMPYEIDAGSLQPGDVHEVRTRYHRWFIANTHEGEMQVEIADVRPGIVRTRVIDDSTFFSTYLKFHGSELRFHEVSPGRTEISLRLDYRRNLDPAWYFQPLQQYAMQQMAHFLISEVIVREH